MDERTAVRAVCILRSPRPRYLEGPHSDMLPAANDLCYVHTPMQVPSRSGALVFPLSGAWGP